MFRNGLVFRIIGAALLIGLVAAGGFMAYRAGVAQGVIQAPAVATAISKAAESGQGAPVPPMYGYGYGYYPRPYGFGHPFGFFPFGAICGSIFFLFLFLGFMKMMFFRRMAWAHYGGHHGPPWMQHNHDWWKENKEGDKKDESPEEKK